MMPDSCVVALDGDWIIWIGCHRLGARAADPLACGDPRTPSTSHLLHPLFERMTAGSGDGTRSQRYGRFEIMDADQKSALAVKEAV